MIVGASDFYIFCEEVKEGFQELSEKHSFILST